MLRGLTPRRFTDKIPATLAIGLPEDTQLLLSLYPTAYMDLNTGIPDIVTTNGESVRITSSDGIDTSWTNLDDRFSHGSIETHCYRCFKRHVLEYENRFPTRITFSCDMCKEQNRIQLDDYSSIESLVHEIQSRVESRESRMAGVEYGRANPSKVAEFRMKSILVLGIGWVTGLLFPSSPYLLWLYIFESTAKRKQLFFPVLVCAVGGLLVAMLIFNRASSELLEVPEQRVVANNTSEFKSGMKYRSFISSDVKVETGG